MVFLLFLLPLVLIGVAVAYVYQNQESIVQTELETINRGYQGKLSIGSTDIAPFKNFPYVSIGLHDVKVAESKDQNANSILEVKDVYIGLTITDLLFGKIDIKKILIEDGFFELILYQDGTDNLSKALASEEEVTDSDPLHVHLKSIELKEFVIRKRDKSNGLNVEGHINWAEGGFESSKEHIKAHVDTEFELNIIKNGDTTYVKQKQFKFQSDLDFNESTGIMNIAPSSIDMDYAQFEISGTIDTKNRMDVDLEIKGSQTNFELFVAFAPDDLLPILKRYDNAGEIYFNATINGPSAVGYDPLIQASFGASEAFLENTTYGRRVDDLGFEGHFTNGTNRNPTTMEFSMVNMRAKLGEGDLTGAVHIKNFVTPEIDMSIEADFDLDFIAEFLNLKEYTDASGTVDLKMKFHDIIDLDQPEKALEDLNQAYYSELTVKNLRVNSTDLPAPLKNLNAHLVMEGRAAELDQFELRIGDSDVSITGFLSDLPALVHQQPSPVTAHLDIQSQLVDLAELTGYSEGDTKGINERVENFNLGLTFTATGRDLTNFTYLPKGEFFVDSLSANLKNYPHRLHDFHVDITVDERDLQIKDFVGYIDDSDFSFSGKVHDYAFWMKDSLEGDVQLDIGLESKRLRLKDLFAYNGENYVPEGYRHESFDDLKLHLKSSMHYESSGLQSVDVELDQFEAKMELHPMRFRNFSGRLRYADDRLLVQDFHAEIGRSIFNIDMAYYLGRDSLQGGDENQLTLKTNYVDFDQLTNFNTDPPSGENQKQEAKPVQNTEDVAEHAEAFNIYELPFSDMGFDVEIDHFIYHRLDIQNVVAKLRTTKDHYLYVDTLSMKAAGGNIAMNGYFNGSNPKRIYLKPNLKLENVDLDQLLFKFENFGQDAIVSENLHGQLSATITGNVRVYPDFVPDLDQSEVHMDVMALNGRLENYEYMLMLSDYFGDKNLNSVRFDTLQNHLDMVNGVLTIPKMTIESTLGHMEISGTQDMQNNFEYFVRIPWRMIKQGAINSVFGNKKSEENEMGEDEIIEVDPNDKVRYLNLKITGTLEDYKIRPGKDKKRKKT
jgi:hypothetical protein